MKISRIAVVMVAACGLAMVGCNNAQKTDGASASVVKPVNAVCPISGGGIEGSTVHVAYKGQEVGLCCNGCTGKWNALSDAEKSAKLASSMKAK